jgi:tRNA (guanine-N7-)-methyltransferase
MRTKYKPWAKPYIDEHKEVMFTLEELSSFDRPYYLEIGSGKGQFLVDMAKKFPNKFFVGVERNVTCCGFTAKKLVEEEIINAKLMFINAEVLMQEIKDESLEGIFLNFSDPWPKKRHHKRRLTAMSYLDNYYRVLKKGARLVIKTDNTDLFAFTLENLENSKFKVISKTDDYNEFDEFDTMTEYEKSFRDEGVKINRIVLEK